MPSLTVLILGGTQFVGRHIAEALLLAGHRVAVFNRGQSGDELPIAVERLRGDRDAGAPGLATLRGRSWDACIDVSGYTPRQVRASAQLLRSSVKRYVFISAVSVYGDPQQRPVTENQDRIEPAGEEVPEVIGAMYGRLKVTCEDIVTEIYGDRSAILRPQIVAGPHDPFDRYSYWVRRAWQQAAVPEAHMLAPGDGADHVQVIDARDLATFAVTVLQQKLAGAFNLAGPRLRWADFVRTLGAKRVVWVATDLLHASGLTEFELPLFRPEHGPRSGLMDVSSERAQAAGLVLTSPEETVRWVRAWVRAWVQGREYVPALSLEREAELLRLARSR